MTQGKWEFRVVAQCPYCGHDSLEFTYFSSEIGVFENGLEIRACEGEDASQSVSGKEHLLRAKCLSCERVFKVVLDLVPSFSPYVLSEFNSEGFIKASFSDCGLPRAVLVGAREIRVEELLSYTPLHAHEEDVLLGLPPFGDFELRLLNSGRCVLSVRPAARDFQTVPDVTQVQCFVTRADKWATELLLKAVERAAKAREKEPRGFARLDIRPGENWEAAASRDLDEYVESLTTQRLGDMFLARAAFTLIRETELLLRRSIWRHLEQSYSSRGQKWWKAMLPSTVVKNVLNVAERSGDRGFQRNRPQDYLTLADLQLVVEGRWADFKKYLPPQQRVLLLLGNLQDRRNDIMHARPITQEQYEEVQSVVGKIRAVFGPVAS